MANLGQMLGADPDRSIHEILAGEGAVSDGLTEAAGLTVVPGEQRIDAFAEADPAKLRRVINTLREAYDLVLVDTGAGLSHETTVPLGLADGVLLVTTPDEVAVSDTQKTAELAARVDGEVVGVLLTRVPDRPDLDEAGAAFDAPVWGAIPADPAVTGEPVVDADPFGGGADEQTPAAAAYAALADAFAARLLDATGEPEPVLEESWFEGDEEESGGRFGLF
jgi:septum site-determining protein MinD